MGYKNMKYGDQAEQPKMPTGTKIDTDKVNPENMASPEVTEQQRMKNQGGADYLGALALEGNSPTKYDYLRDATAKDLLNSHVLTTISNEISRKNLNTEMAQMGLNNSNYSKTAEALMGNAYMQAINQNKADADKRLMEYDMQEAADKADRQDKSVESLAKSLASSTRQDSIETYLKGYGINVAQDLQGNYVLNGEGWDKLTNDQRQQVLNALVASKEARINTDEEAQNLRADRIVEFIASAQTVSAADNYLVSKGFEWDGKRWVKEGLTEDQLNGINDQYANSVYALTQQDVNSASYRPDYVSAIEGQTTDDGKTWQEAFPSQYKILENLINKGQVNNGDKIRLFSQNGKKAVYAVYENGSFTKISEEEYWKAGRKVDITDAKGGEASIIHG